MVQQKVKRTLISASILTSILVFLALFANNIYLWFITIFIILLVYLFVYLQAHPFNRLRPGRIYELTHCEYHGSNISFVIFRTANQKKTVLISKNIHFQDEPKVGQNFLAKKNERSKGLILCVVKKD
ncbi:MAG: hypothetical protein WC863_00950 [Patescibacteria group bacterium]